MESIRNVNYFNLTRLVRLKFHIKFQSWSAWDWNSISITFFVKRDWPLISISISITGLVKTPYMTLDGWVWLAQLNTLALHSIKCISNYRQICLQFLLLWKAKTILVKKISCDEDHNEHKKKSILIYYSCIV